jgi:NADPH:quinone reductase-like Zn-dependent oxidoreductase
LCLVTRAACQVRGDDVVDPIGAALWGLGQTLAAELPRSGCLRIDLPREGSIPDEVADAVLGASAEDRLAYRTDGWRAARLVRAEPQRGISNLRRDAEYVLEIRERGRLDRLELAPAPEPQPLAADAVRIRVAATGLNFRDVLNALGMYPGDAGALGSECVGIVEALGASVRDLAVGDTVMSITPRGFCSHVDAPVALTLRVPGGVSVAGAATIPVAFLTADWALHELARMRVGDRVLVHAAAGGVGLAAVQLALTCGAEVFATAGSEWKRAALRRMGITHVYDSRSLDFREQILRDTGGAGVDVVLNSLADEFIPASLDALADNGRFVEIGKTAVWDAQRVRAVRPNAEYHVLYLGDACSAYPERIRARFLALCGRFESGELRPLRAAPRQSRSVRQSRGCGSWYRRCRMDHGRPRRSGPIHGPRSCAARLQAVSAERARAS